MKNVTKPGKIKINKLINVAEGLTLDTQKKGKKRYSAINGIELSTAAINGIELSTAKYGEVTLSNKIYRREVR